MILFPELVPKKGATRPMPQTVTPAGYEFIAVLRALETAVASGPGKVAEPAEKPQISGKIETDFSEDPPDTDLPEEDAFEIVQQFDDEPEEPLFIEATTEFESVKPQATDRPRMEHPFAEAVQPRPKGETAFVAEVEPPAALESGRVPQRSAPPDPAAWNAPKAAQAPVWPAQDLPTTSMKEVSPPSAAPVSETAAPIPENAEDVRFFADARAPRMEPVQTAVAWDPVSATEVVQQAKPPKTDLPTPAKAVAKPDSASDRAPLEPTTTIAPDPKTHSASLPQVALQKATPEPRENPARIEAGKPVEDPLGPNSPRRAVIAGPRTDFQGDVRQTAESSAPLAPPIGEVPAIAPSDKPEVSVTALTMPIEVVDAPSRPSTHFTVLAIDRPETPRAVAVQLSEAVRSSDGDSISIRLDPEELGAVRMKLNHSDGQITVSISAERPETLDLMRRHVDQLAQEMRGLGYASMRFDFQQQNQRNGQPSESSAGPQAEPESPAISPFRAPRQLAAAGGLDIRL